MRHWAALSGDSATYALETLEQRHILGVLDRLNWNKSQAAQILGIERSTLDRKLKRYQVSRPGTCKTKKIPDIFAKLGIFLLTFYRNLKKI